MWEAVDACGRGRQRRRPARRSSTPSTSCTARPGSTTTRSGGCASASASTPRRRHYSGIGGTTPQVLVQEQAARIARGELDVALVVGAEALDTQRRYKKRGERYPYSFKPGRATRVPVGGAVPPGRGRARGVPGLADVRPVRQRTSRSARHRARRVPAALGEQWHRFTEVAAANPEAWFPVERSAAEIITPTPENRLVASPYTKYMVSIMDVDMAAAVFVVAEETADALGVPRDRRVYLRGWQYATDPVYVAEHPDLASSPAMGIAAGTALRSCGRRHRRRRAPRPVLVLRLVGELHARRARDHGRRRRARSR